MKKRVVRLTMIGLLNVIGLVVMVGSAQAQSLGDTIRINVPFEFSVGDTKLPAGEYSVGRAQPTSGDTTVIISNVNHPGSVLRITNAAQSLKPKYRDTLVFHRYGDDYFLFQVWPAGSSVGRELVKSRNERRVERQSHYGAVLVRLN